MSAPSVRWTLRLPWSTQVCLQELLRLDAPGRIGDICGRAIVHLLDQGDALVTALAVHAAAARAERPSERTVLVSLRIDPQVRARLLAWQTAHPQVPLSWCLDGALRGWHAVCQAHAQQGVATAGLEPRRYRRLARELVVIVDGDDAAHAA